MKVLVAFGAKVDYVNAKHMTALDSASLNNQQKVVELLKRVGAHTGDEISSKSKKEHAKNKLDNGDEEMDTRQSGNKLNIT